MPHVYFGPMLKYVFYTSFKHVSLIGALASTWRPWVSGLVGRFVQA